MSTFTLISIYRGPPFFPFSVNYSFSLRKVGKAHDSYPRFFSILHMHTNFYYDRANNKEKNWEYDPCKVGLINKASATMKSFLSVDL